MRETAEFLRIWWVQIVFFVGLIAAWVKSMKAQENFNPRSPWGERQQICTTAPLQIDRT